MGHLSSIYEPYHTNSTTSRGDGREPTGGRIDRRGLNLATQKVASPKKLPGVGSPHFAPRPELYVAHRPVMPSGEAAMAGMLAAPERTPEQEEGSEIPSNKFRVSQLQGEVA